MKLGTLNLTNEDRQVANLALVLEGIFTGSELTDISGENMVDGIRILQEISAGEGDDLSYDQIELALTVWDKLRALIKDSAPGLKEQAEINKLIGMGSS